MASQTRAVGERAAKLVGVELPKKAAKAAPAKKAPAKKAPAKKAPAKKAAAKKVTQKYNSALSRPLGRLRVDQGT